MEYAGIKIIGINKEGIEKENSFETAYKYPLILSAKPDDLWIKFFHAIYRVHPFEKKRQYTIIDKQIFVIASGEDNKQQLLDLFKEVVNAANQKYTEILKTKEEERLKEETRKKREKEKIEEMRSEIDRLNFS